MIIWIMGLWNSMKLWAMPCRATQDRGVMVESSDKTCSTGEGTSKPLQFSCLENVINSKKRQKDMRLKDEPPRLVGVQHPTGEEQRKTFRKNEQAEPNWKRCPAVHVSGGESEVRCWKNTTAQEPGTLGRWITVNWKWSKRRWQERTLTFLLE